MTHLATQRKPVLPGFRLVMLVITLLFCPHSGWNSRDWGCESRYVRPAQSGGQGDDSTGAV